MGRHAALAVLGLIALAAHAQTADRPEVRPGDQWRFSISYGVPSTEPKRTWIVRTVTETAIEGTENGEPLSLTRELNVLDSPTFTETSPRRLAFPMAVGDRWQFETDWLFKPKASRGRVSVAVEVAGYEKVTVPAGEFEAFRLTIRETVSGKAPIGSFYEGETRRTYWYAPAARAVVKSVSHNPYLGPSTVELVGYELR